MEFGYYPPSGDRGIEIIRPREYLSDLYRALEVAAQPCRLRRSHPLRCSSRQDV